jgi:hypothetical protein
MSRTRWSESGLGGGPGSGPPADDGRRFRNLHSDGIRPEIQSVAVLQLTTVEKVWRLGGDRHLQNAVALMTEQVIGRFDIVQLEAMGYHRRQIDAP